VVSAGVRSRYALFVLGELLAGPFHGYLLREILSAMLGPLRRVSWGALYPVLRRLERDGLIATDTPGTEAEKVEATATAVRRQRIVYQITPAGRARFRELMLAPAEDVSAATELFLIKINCFAYVSREDQQAVFASYRSYLQMVEAHCQGTERFVRAHASIPSVELPHILRTISFRLCSTQAELEWITREMDALAATPSETDRKPAPARAGGDS
jgi:DNA-binding PadR family transcriptional regulator